MPEPTNSQPQLFALLDEVDSIRLASNKQLDESKRGQLGQFMTPQSVTKLMASMFEDCTGDIRLLDAGAGVGSLTSAFVHEACLRGEATSLSSTTYEIDPILESGLRTSLAHCRNECAGVGVRFVADVHSQDFIESAVDILTNKEADRKQFVPFTKAILNPPYLKIAASSKERKLLRSAGIETGNLYSGFVALAIKLLAPGGELVAITPRSFCNGPYFKSFRELIFNETAIRKIRVFDSRTSAFKGDKVLQENVIFHLVKGEEQDSVSISSSSCADDEEPVLRLADANEVVDLSSDEKFIHVVTTDAEAEIARRVTSLPCSLPDLNVEVSTGRVVDFRNKNYLTNEQTRETVPLFYSLNIRNGLVDWPIVNPKKTTSILNTKETQSLMVPDGYYVLTKRLSSKEEARRIVTGVHVPVEGAQFQCLGFDNKTNYFHSEGHGLSESIAYGLSVFLSSSVVDRYFRQFNGHTQVNATDLRSLRYPTLQQLEMLGAGYQEIMASQDLIDERVDGVLF